MSESKAFDQAFKRLMKNEGGYVNHPRDPGGETMYGVTKRVAIANGYKGSMRNLPIEFAEKVARKSYWDTTRCDDLDPLVASQLFDAAYNHGPRNAVKFLQRAVGVTADGMIGPMTIAATNAKPPYSVVLNFLSERLDFFTRIGTWSTFGKGWSRRIAEQLAFAAKDFDLSKDA